MKIALVSPYDFPYPGGVTEHIIALAVQLRQRGHEVHVLAACSGYQHKTFYNTRSVTHRVATIPIGGTVARVGVSPLSYFRIKKILQSEAFDVVHLQEPLTPGITWLVLSQAHSLGHAVTVGTFHAYHEQPNWLYVKGRPIFRMFFAKLDGLIAVSEAAREFAHRMFPGDYQIIPNGIDLSRFGKKVRSTPLGQSKKTITILFVGRLDWRKGFDNLLESFISLKPRRPQLRLVVVGPFDAKACEPYQKVAQIKNALDIEFVGYVSPERLPSFYHRADLFCAPSVGFESFGIVLLEAMAAGLPIVASDIAGYRSVVSHGQEGFLVPPDQPTYLTQALGELLDDPWKRNEMARRGRLKADRYSWDYIANQILEVYHHTIRRKNKSAHPNQTVARRIKANFGDRSLRALDPE